MANTVKRPRGFEGIYGHSAVISYLERSRKNGTLSQFICFEGEPGLGKSTIAKILACLLTHATEAEYTAVFENNTDTQAILTFKMSLEGGVNVVKEAVAAMSTGFTRNKVKVIILEEAHAMKAEAQDALLTPTEYLPEGVYVFMCTTDTSHMRKALLSRCNTVRLRRLKRSEMFELMDSVLLKRRLTLEPRAKMLDIISDYSENRPRDALKVIENMGFARTVQLQELKDLLNLREPEEATKLLVTLGGSLYDGLQILFTMKVDPDYQKLLMDVCNECLRVKNGMMLIRYEMQDVANILNKVDQDVLVDFLYNISNITLFNDSSLMAAYLKTHPERRKLFEKTDGLVEQEQRRKQTEAVETNPRDVGVIRHKPTIEELLRTSKKVAD